METQQFRSNDLHQVSARAYFFLYNETMRVNQLIVVEGKHDEAVLKRILDADIVITHGLHNDEALFDVLREAVKTRGVIVFTDPDHPGQRIRQRIAAAVPGVSHAYLNADDARGSGKVGIEHASEAVLLEALGHLITFNETPSPLTRADLFDLGLSGHPESQARRQQISQALHLPDVNAKQLLNFLRALNLTTEQIRQLLNENSN